MVETYVGITGLAGGTGSCCLLQPTHDATTVAKTKTKKPFEIRYSFNFTSFCYKLPQPNESSSKHTQRTSAAGYASS